MTTATRFRDYGHARIYSSWLLLPAWRHMRPLARLLLVEILADFRPGNNGKLEWSLTRVQRAINCGRATASACLNELEIHGWISVMRVGRFAGNRKPSVYRVTMFKCDETGEPPSREYETWTA